MSVASGPRRVLSLEKAVQVLRCFSGAEPELGLSQLCQRTSLPKSVAYRLAQTLEGLGLLERSPRTRKYRVGAVAFEIGAQYLAANPVGRVAREAIEELAATSGHTAYLGVLDRGDTLMLAVHEGAQPVRIVGAAGDRFPAEMTAIGRAMLAAKPPAFVDELYRARRPASRAGKTPPTIPALLADLELTRRRGWALSVEETYPGVWAVGVAVLGPAGEPVAGVSLAFPASGEAPALAERLANLVSHRAKSISHRLTLDGSLGVRV
ncbi:MAG: IclR family transcriptional regulator [Chloroflexi bacterium]|nr:IclR family transcriptional regulator [Chloroflexota bacterium]